MDKLAIKNRQSAAQRGKFAIHRSLMGVIYD